MFLAEERLDTLRAFVQTENEPTGPAWTQLLNAAEADLERSLRVQTDWWVPWYYVQPDEHNRLKNVLRDVFRLESQ